MIRCLLRFNWISKDHHDPSKLNNRANGVNPRIGRLNLLLP